MFASRRLTQLVAVAPEHSIERQGLLIDTDPRHVGHTPIEELDLPGVSGVPVRPSSGIGTKAKGKKKKEDSEKTAQSYMTEAQKEAELVAQEDRILYEMRQNLQKLKEYGKEIGFSFDISKKKSQFGRMQGEKWQDEELDTWKKQASRMLVTPEPKLVQMIKEEPQVTKMSEYVFHLERMLNEMKFFRQKKQDRRDMLKHEFDVAEHQEQREQSGAGKMATQFERLAKAKERIQDTDQKILAESELCKELTKENEEELAATQELRDLVEETAKQLKNYDHDIEHLKIQLKDSMHEVEKCLQQGKLVTMGEVKSEIKERYKEELALRNKTIQKQKQIKDMIAAHELRVKELTVKLQQQYDPNKDSPRRKELKRKEQAFEEVFDTMMKRIGESDIERIVEMFQKQTLTFEAWTEAVRDQEIRVKALQDEKKNLDKQLHKVSSNKQHGIANETRQFTISGRRLDMATERLDNSSMRLMELEGLIAHIKESMRETLARLKEHKSDVYVPLTSHFPNDGEGGLTEQIRSFAETVVSLQPEPEKYQKLLAAVKTLDTYSERTSSPAASPLSPKRESHEIVATMPKALKLAISKAADDIAQSASQESFEQEYNRRIPLPLSREKAAAAKKQEEEQDEAEARADTRDIVTRDDIKRLEKNLLKKKEREKAEAEARDRGEVSPTKKKKSDKPASSPG